MVVVDRHQGFGLTVMIMQGHAKRPHRPPDHFRVEGLTGALATRTSSGDRRHGIARGHHQPVHRGSHGDVGDVLRNDDPQGRFDAEAPLEEGGGVTNCMGPIAEKAMP